MARRVPPCAVVPLFCKPQRKMHCKQQFIRQHRIALISSVKSRIRNRRRPRPMPVRFPRHTRATLEKIRAGEPFTRFLQGGSLWLAMQPIQLAAMASNGNFTQFPDALASSKRRARANRDAGLFLLDETQFVNAHGSQAFSRRAGRGVSHMISVPPAIGVHSLLLRKQFSTSPDARCDQLMRIRIPRMSGSSIRSSHSRRLPRSPTQKCG